MPNPMIAAMIPITTACMAPPVRGPRGPGSLLALGYLPLHLLAPRLLLGQVVAQLLQLSFHLRELVGQLLLARRRLLGFGEPSLQLIELPPQRLHVGAPHEVADEKPDEDRHDGDDRHLLAVHHASFPGRGARCLESLPGELARQTRPGERRAQDRAAPPASCCLSSTRRSFPVSVCGRAETNAT